MASLSYTKNKNKNTFGDSDVVQTNYITMNRVHGYNLILYILSIKFLVSNANKSFCSLLSDGGTIRDISIFNMLKMFTIAPFKFDLFT